jgi:hypothetical protein
MRHAPARRYSDAHRDHVRRHGLQGEGMSADMDEAHADSAQRVRKPVGRPREWQEIAGVALLSAVAVLTAWCGFESSKWGGEMSIAFSEASSNRVQASDASSAARDAFQLDAMVFAEWLVATQAGDDELADYLRGVFSPALDKAFVAWDGVTRTPFGLPEYVPPGTVEAEAFTAKANEAYERAVTNNQIGDNYSLLTVMFALVLFLSAMSQRTGPAWAQSTLLYLAMSVTVIGIGILATFPVNI